MKASDEAKPQGRSSDVPHVEIIIVGAGQAGLSMGYWLEVDGATRLGRWLKAQPEPVLGLEQKQALREKQVQIKPRVTSA